MKALGWPRSFAVPGRNGGTMAESRLTRVVLWITRGEVPVDGVLHVDVTPPPETTENYSAECLREAEEAGLIPRAPVRWGNFR
jgi:hypothetical protein